MKRTGPRSPLKPAPAQGLTDTTSSCSAVRARQQKPFPQQKQEKGDPTSSLSHPLLPACRSSEGSGVMVAALQYPNWQPELLCPALLAWSWERRQFLAGQSSLRLCPGFLRKVSMSPITRQV